MCESKRRASLAVLLSRGLQHGQLDVRVEWTMRSKRSLRGGGIWCAGAVVLGV